MSTRLPMASVDQNTIIEQTPASASAPVTATTMLSPPLRREAKPEPIEVDANTIIKREDRPSAVGPEKKERDMSKHTVRATPYGETQRSLPAYTPHRHMVAKHGAPASADQHHHHHHRYRQHNDENFGSMTNGYGMTASAGRSRPISRHETPAHPLRLGPPPPAMTHPRSRPPTAYSPHGDWSPYPLTTPHPYPVPGQSPYHHPMSNGPPPSAEQLGDARHPLGATTPTPISRAYRSQHHASTPSYASMASSANTPMSIKTPYSVAATQCHMAGTGDRVLLERVNVHHPDLHGLDPAAEWISANPPDYWLVGDDRRTMVNSPYDGDVEGYNFKKKLTSSRSFRSRNPWDYLVKDGRENFSEAHRMFLEATWLLSSNPTTNERERLGAWMGVATRRITVFFQNRRQTLVNKTKGNSTAAHSRRNSIGSDDGYLGLHAQPASAQKGKSMSFGSDGDDGHFEFRLNDGRGLVNIDDGWKWTSDFTGPPPMPDDDMLGKLSVAYAIFKGQLDHHCYYQKWLAAKMAMSSAARSGSTSSSSSSSHFSRHPSYTPPMYAMPHLPQQHRLDDVVVGNGLPTPARHRPPRVPQWENGHCVNLANMIPTDPPSEAREPSSEPLQEGDEHEHEARVPLVPRANRGERVPSFAMRTERTSRLARASAADIYRSSGRAKALSGYPSAGSVPRSASGSPFTRTESLPVASLGTQPAIFGHPSSSAGGPRPGLPIRGARQSYPASSSASSTVRPPLHTQPRNSFSRSQSDFGLARPHSRQGASPVPTEIDDTEKPDIGADFDMEAAELLMGMSRSTTNPTDSASGSGSGSQ